MAYKRISVITVNYNHSNVTEELLQSILLTTHYPDLEIIVVDNGSVKNPVSRWRVLFPMVKFIRSDVNLGFAGGNNLGIKHATGEYYFLVNNDTEFTPRLMETLSKTLTDNSEVGMISPKIKYFDQPDKLQYVGFTPMNYFTARNKCIGQFEIDKGQYDNLTGQTGFAHGAAMMIRKEAVAKAGLMADNYFLYYEEMDWCDRIKKAGFEVWVCPQATIYHKESVSVGQSSPLKEYFMNRNRILYIRKNAQVMSRVIFMLFFTIVVVPRNIFNYLRKGRFDFIPILFRAMWWNVNQKKDSTYLGYTITN